jgi:hypothetical protein
MWVKRLTDMQTQGQTVPVNDEPELLLDTMDEQRAAGARPIIDPKGVSSAEHVPVFMNHDYGFPESYLGTMDDVHVDEEGRLVGRFHPAAGREAYSQADWLRWGVAGMAKEYVRHPDGDEILEMVLVEVSYVPAQEADND